MLNWFVSIAHAQGTGGGGSGSAGGGDLTFTIMMFGSIILIWWLIVIRPQAKQAQNHRTMVAALKRGDSVITKSGMYGKVASVEEDGLLLEVAKGVKIRFLKDRVAQTVADGTPTSQEKK
ncbi:MAG: preprotein translocase subunit YajC [Myxococcota bacterium]|nr:preprotein translocase subunit YajC [Myxococcota bacterium]